MPASWAEERESDGSSDMSEEEQKRRGRKPVRPHWTRVKSLEQIKGQQVLVYDCQSDLAFDKNVKMIRRELEQEVG